MIVPRIRGKVGQIDEPAEWRGKWMFSVWITEMGGGDIDEEKPFFGPSGPYETAEIAQTELRRCVRMISEKFEEVVTGEVQGKYIDMKTNLTRFWDKRDEH